jgi:hypothetical protein
VPVEELKDGNRRIERRRPFDGRLVPDRVHDPDLSPAASACDVRVIGSSTIHEKPRSPRSSQKRIDIDRA